MSRPSRVSVSCLCLLTVLLGLTSGATADDRAAAVTKVLGDAGAWKIAPETYVAAGTAEEPVLAMPPGQAFTITSTKTYSAPLDVEVTFRLKPAAGATAALSLTLGTGETPEKAPKWLGSSVSTTHASNYVSYSANIHKPEPPPTTSGTITFQAVTDQNLGWSEEMRRTIEAQTSSAPKPEQTLMRLRCTVDDQRFRTWVNGRFVSDIAVPAGFDTSGTVVLTAYPYTEVVSVRVEPLKAATSRFEPLSIAGHVNSSKLQGQRVDPASLPKGEVDGIPFEFVAPGEGVLGNDHIDVSQSWTRFGAIPGYIASNFGAFGGRWIAADRIDPSRNCLYVPRGRYKALHLIAVADTSIHKDAVPLVSAQFYRPNAGHPFNFEALVPPGKGAGKATAVPIKLANGGKSAKLYRVTVPLDPDAFSWFTDLDRIGMEITKQVHYYRAYPDPLEFSWHGGGLPSNVQIYAMTLEKADVDIDLQPENFGHVWTAPAKPKYTVELRNGTGKATTARLTIKTRSHDGKDTSEQKQDVALPADDSPVKAAIELSPRRYGLHEMEVTVDAAGEKPVYRRSFAHLHEDTREKEVWQHGRGPIFGYWAWGGGHDTPKSDKEIEVMAAAGAETSTANYSLAAPEIQALAEKHRFISENAFFGGSMYHAGFYAWYQGAPKWDPNDPEGSGKALIESLKKGGVAQANAISRPTFLPFFAEPQFGTITTGIWPTHYGEEYKLTADEQKVFEDMRAKFVAGARAVRKEWPNVKILLPYGDPMVPATMMRLAPETRELVDGVAIDIPGFERMPEQQVNQVVLNRLYPIMKDIKEHVKDPYFVLIEGTCVSSKDLDTGQQEQADISVRNFLVFMGYGVNIFESGSSPFDCANYWGENHYGGGWNARLPLAMPKIAYVHYATMSRHLNRANFVKYVQTGSTSTFSQQFKHYKTRELVHTLWTIRGKRPVSIAVPAGTTLELYDPHDNVTKLTEKNGVVTFTVDQSPQYLRGLKEEPKITLGESDHSDSKPAEISEKIANIGDGSWQLRMEEDVEYAKNKALQIERFLAEMDGKSVEAPKAQGRKALAVHLKKQAKDRGVMPFYTTIAPKKPIEIDGKASHLGLWVHAASDWGRVVYDVRDAKGEKWISVGTKEDWNNDDIHGWSHFAFDGWRYLRFQLPSSLPYDSYRERGTSWWGSYGGDGVVDLPLRLEKIIIERRPKAIYGNDLVAVKPDDVLLGDLYAEYANEDDREDEIVRLAALRMPTPAELPNLTNPIAELVKTGVGAPTKVLRVTDPDHWYDGTRTHVHFEPVAGAKSYDVWVSPYPDGRGALKVATGWTESGGLIQGLRPDREFYAFVVYTDAEGKLSKPSAPLPFTLKGRFGYK